MDIALLKTVLGIPTKTGQERLVVNFLMDHCTKRGWPTHVDRHGNVFVTKGTSPTGFYPLVCAHTDSVHNITFPSIKIVAEAGTGNLYGVDPIFDNRTGCGGDDKAGVFICLQLLEHASCLKAAFFVGEEHYCIGSQAAGPEFFQDVGYCMEFDSPQGNIVSYACDGTQLFEENGEFAKLAVPIMDSHGMVNWQRHPYTDVAILKRRYTFTCVNLPAGYYNMHTSHEYVVPSDVEKAIEAGKQILEALGFENYPFKSRSTIAETERETTGLVLSDRS